MSLIQKQQIDRDINAPTGLTGDDIAYSSGRTVNEKIDENLDTTAIPLLRLQESDILSQRGAYSIEGGNSFDLPLAQDFYSGRYLPWVINNITGHDILINATAPNTINTVDGNVTSVTIKAGEAGILYVIEAGTWAFAGAVQKPVQISSPTEDFYQFATGYINSTNVFTPILFKNTDTLDGEYLVTISGQWSLDDDKSMLEAELVYDGNVIFKMDVEPKDKLNETPFSWTGIVSGVGSKFFEFSARSTVNGKVSKIDNCFLIMQKWEI